MTDINLLSNYNLINYLLKVIPKYINNNINIKLTDDTITIQTSNDYLLSLINFLKNHFKLQYKTLIGITAVDYPEKENRFKLFYFLLSYKLNNRIIVTINTSDVKPVNSITSIYSGAN
jgi:NADH:ubiquinone oxidoreductase subunit C